MFVDFDKVKVLYAYNIPTYSMYACTYTCYLFMTYINALVHLYLYTHAYIIMIAMYYVHTVRIRTYILVYMYVIIVS